MSLPPLRGAAQAGVVLLPRTPLATDGDIRGADDMTIKARKSNNLANLDVVTLDGADGMAFGDAADATTTVQGSTVTATGATAVAVTATAGTVTITATAGSDNKLALSGATGVSTLGGETSSGLAVNGSDVLRATAGTVTVGVQGTDEPDIVIASILGTATWGIYTGNTVSTAHKVMQWGYNYNHATRVDNSDVGWALGMEINYDAGAGNFLDELNLNWISADGLTTRRPFASAVNRTTLLATVDVQGKLDHYADGGGTANGEWAANGALAVGASTPGADWLSVQEAAQAGANAIALRVVAGAHTAMPASNDVPCVKFDLSATRQWATGAVANEDGVQITYPTFAFVGASTVTDAATLHVTGAPVAGANATLTNKWAAKLDGPVKVEGLLSVVHNNGLRVTPTAGTYGLTLSSPGANLMGFDPYGTTKTIRFSQYFKVDGVDGAASPQPMVRLDSLGLGSGKTNEGLTVANEYATTVGSQTQYSPVFYLCGNAWDIDGAAARYMGWSQQVYCTPDNLPYSDLVIGGHYSTTTTRGTVNEIVRYRHQNGGTPALAIGYFGATPVGQQTSGANVTNNVTAGGTDNTIDNWTDLTTYATDAAAIRNAVYQLARKVKQLNDGVRSLGLFT